MTAVPFDTLALARRLREKAGFTAEHAEAASEALADAMSGADLATKADLRELELRVKAEIGAAKNDTLRWVFGIALAQVGAIVALLKLLQ